MANGSQNMTTDKARQALYLDAPNEYGYYTDQYGNFIYKYVPDPENPATGYFHLDNNAKTISLRYYWDSGDIWVPGKVGIGYNPTTSGNTYSLYVNGTSYFTNTAYFGNGTTYYISADGSQYSGNAATATNSDKLGGIVPRGFLRTYLNYNDIASFDTVGADNYLYSHSDTGNITGGTKPAGSHNGFAVLNTHSHSGNYCQQLGFDVANDCLWYRTADNSSSFNAWRKLLSSSNYTDYTVTKTGSGASGTWGISISGNAATATALTSSAGSARQPVYFSSGKPVAANNTVAHFGNAGKNNMNDVGRLHASSGMTNLSSTGNADTPQCGTDYRSGWHLYWSTNYSDDPNGTNAWVAQIINRAGTDEWWVRSRNGGTITNGTAWASSWRHLVTSAQAGVGGGTTPIYVNGNGEVVACTSYANASVASATKATQDADGKDIRQKYVSVYNTSNIGSSSSVTFTNLAAAGNAVGMIYAATDNPRGGAGWVHCISLCWAKGTTSSWISQLAFGVESGNGMWYRTTSGNIAGCAWKRVLDDSNYTSYTVTKTGSGASGTWGINVTGSSGSCTGHAASDLALTGGTLSGDLGFKTGSADSPDIVWWYGNTGKEQARIWMGSGGSSKWAPYYRCYNSSGTQLYSGNLVCGDGTGASGTWGISITGNAATATRASTVGDGSTNAAVSQLGLISKVSWNPSVTSARSAVHHIVMFNQSLASVWVCGTNDIYVVIREGTGWVQHSSGSGSVNVSTWGATFYRTNGSSSNYLSVKTNNGSNASITIISF